MKAETKFRKSVRKDLNTLPSTAIFPIQQASIKGDPDYILCIQGQFVALELKDVGERPSPLQQHKLDNVLNAGGSAFVADKSNWPDIFALLKNLAC